MLAGDRHESLIIINQGRVKAFRYSQEGREQILYLFAVGDFFGETNLLKDQEITYNIEALEATGLCTIRKSDFQQLIRSFPEIGFKVMAELCARLEGLENILQSMGNKSVELRVNAVLLEFANKFGQDHPRGILVELPLSREGIANYIGLTRETVSRKMSLLQEERIIEMVGNKKVIILDKKELEQSLK